MEFVPAVSGRVSEVLRLEDIALTLLLFVVAAWNGMPQMGGCMGSQLMEVRYRYAADRSEENRTSCRGGKHVRLQII
jgi:hypothetical protein